MHLRVTGTAITVKTNHNINNKTFIHTLAIHHDKQLCQWLEIQPLIMRLPLLYIHSTER